MVTLENDRAAPEKVPENDCFYGVQGIIYIDSPFVLFSAGC
jgi:hypothetical protein